jgi:hypothetical protein
MAMADRRTRAFSSHLDDKKSTGRPVSEQKLANAQGSEAGALCRRHDNAAAFAGSFGLIVVVKAPQNMLAP